MVSLLMCSVANFDNSICSTFLPYVRYLLLILHQLHCFFENADAFTSLLHLGACSCLLNALIHLVASRKNGVERQNLMCKKTISLYSQQSVDMLTNTLYKLSYSKIIVEDTEAHMGCLRI